MKNIPPCFDAMLAAWNELDLKQIRGHLDQALAPTVVFADPDNFVEGIDAFVAMVQRFRQRVPNAKCDRTSGVNVHHQRFRYEWLVSADSQPLVAGMDVVEINAQALVVRVDGFFGPILPVGSIGR